MAKTKMHHLLNSDTDKHAAAAMLEAHHPCQRTQLNLLQQDMQSDAAADNAAMCRPVRLPV